MDLVLQVLDILILLLCNIQAGSRFDQSMPAVKAKLCWTMIIIQVCSTLTLMGCLTIFQKARRLTMRYRHSIIVQLNRDVLTDTTRSRCGIITDYGFPDPSLPQYPYDEK